MITASCSAGERATRRHAVRIAGLLGAQLHSLGAGVVIETEHTCRTLRGVPGSGSRTTISALLGSLREDSRSRQEFFALAGIDR